MKQSSSTHVLGIDLT